MRALVTGGAGFIGSAVVERLVAHGHEVYVVDDLSSGRLSNLEEARREGHMKFHRFDIRSDNMSDLFVQTEPEVVLHLAAQPSVPASVSDPVRDAEVNIVGLLHVLDACVAAKVRKIVFSSSGGTIYGPQTKLPVKESAHGRPISPYGITKHSAENYLRFYRAEFDLDFTSLALANVYGPRQDPLGEAGVIAAFSSKLVRGLPVTIDGTGEQTRDFVYVDDVAHAFVRATDAGSGETINVATGKETSIKQLYEVIAKAAAYSGEAHYGPSRQGDIMRSSLDAAKAAKLLDWRAWTTLREGIDQTVAYFERLANAG